MSSVYWPSPRTSIGSSVRRTGWPMPKFPTITSCFILDPIRGKLLHYFARTRSVEPLWLGFDFRPRPVVTCRMTLEHSNEREAIRDAIDRVCARFGDDYWLERDRTGAFPHELHAALAADGWLGIAIPEAYRGAGLGITEAALMMQAIAASGAAMSGASAVHMNIFGLNPVVVFGTEEQKRRWLPPLIEGREKACFAVTEPNVGLDTTRLKTRAVRDGDYYVLTGQKVWISTAQLADRMLILARTTPLDQCPKPTFGLSLFYTKLDRAFVTALEF